MIVNMNDSVKVKLNDEGRRIVKEYYSDKGKLIPDHFIPACLLEPKEDEEGRTEWQLWHLMRVFGCHIQPFCPCPFETDIMILEKESNQ